jgi:hypothetical protein
VVAADAYPLLYDSKPASYTDDRVPYNEWTGATWQLTEVSNNGFVLMHYFATNCIATPVMGVVGQADYSTIGDARDGAEAELASLLMGTLPTPEMVPIATVIFQTSDSYSNVPQARIRSTNDGSDYLDWRKKDLPGGAAGVTNHNFTTNKQGGNGSDEYYHHTSVDYILSRSHPVADVAHGFVVGDVLYITGADTYAKAQSSIHALLGKVMVSEVVDVDNFKVSGPGFITVPAHGFTPGARLYLHATVAGTLTETPQTNWDEPIAVAVNTNVLLMQRLCERAKRVGSETFGTDRTDWAPGNATIWKESVTFRANPTADVDVNSFAPATDGFTIGKWIFNISTTKTMTAVHEDAGSTAAYRILCPDGVDIPIPPLGWLFVWYDFTSSRWRAVGEKSRFDDNIFRVVDEADPTKEIAFEASGITTGNTRTVTMPDEDATIGTAQYIKLYSQAAEPTLDADNKVGIWKDTDDADRVYLIFRRGVGDHVKVELT